MVTLSGHYLPGVPGEVLNENTAAALGLPPGMTPDQQERHRRQQLYYEEYQRVKKLEEEEEERQEELRRKQELLEQQQQQQQQQQHQQQGQGGQGNGGEEDAPVTAGGGRRAKQRRDRRRELSTAAPGGDGNNGRFGLSTQQGEPGRTPGTGATKDPRVAGTETRGEGVRHNDGARRARRQREERNGHEPLLFREKEKEGGWESDGRRGPSEWKKAKARVPGGDERVPPAENDAEAGEEDTEAAEAGIGRRWGGRNQVPGEDTDGPGRTFESMVWDVEQNGVSLSWGREGEAYPGHERQARQRRRRHLLLQPQETGESHASGSAVSLTGLVGGAGVEEESDGDKSTRRAEGEEKRPFDLSVLCTVISDVNHLMKPRYPVDPRLVDALLWDVDVSEGLGDQPCSDSNTDATEHAPDYLSKCRANVPFFFCPGS